MKRFLLIMMAVALVVAGVLSYYASKSPDGLERVAHDQGFIAKEIKQSFSLIPDYKFPGLGGFLGNLLAGVIGVMATYGLVLLVSKIITLRKKSRRNNCAPYPH